MLSLCIALPRQHRFVHCTGTPPTENAKSFKTLNTKRLAAALLPLAAALPCLGISTRAWLLQQRTQFGCQQPQANKQDCARAHTRTHARTRAQKQKHARADARAHTSANALKHAHARARTHTHTRIHAHTHTHTRTRGHTHEKSRARPPTRTRAHAPQHAQRRATFSSQRLTFPPPDKLAECWTCQCLIVLHEEECLSPPHESNQACQDKNQRARMSLLIFCKTAQRRDIKTTTRTTLIIQARMHWKRQFAAAVPRLLTWRNDEHELAQPAQKSFAYSTGYADKNY